MERGQGEGGEGGRGGGQRGGWEGEGGGRETGRDNVVLIPSKVNCLSVC